MLAKQIHVLRKDQVRTGSAVQLPIGKTIQSKTAMEGQSLAGGPMAAEARIVESNSDYVILEIVCGCGQKSFVQCNYGNVAGSPDLQETRS